MNNITIKEEYIQDEDEECEKTKNYIYQILNSSYRGKFLMLAYKKNFEKSKQQSKCTDGSSDDENEEEEKSDESLLFNRSHLCSIIIENEFFVKGFDINRERFHFLTQQLVELFPKEKAEQYYSESTRGSGGPICAKGSLYNKYKKFRAEAIQVGLLVNRKRKHEKKVEESNSLNNEIEKEDSLKGQIQTPSDENHKSPDDSLQPNDIQLHPEVTARWQYILKNGNSEDDNAQLVKKYPTSEVLITPTLNPDISASLSADSLEQDINLVETQNTISSALGALGTGISMLLEDKDNLDVTKLMEVLGDTGRILAGLHNQQSRKRRNHILLNVGETTKETIEKTSIDSFLFGVSEKVETKELVEDKEVKSPSVKKKFVENEFSGNLKALSENKVIQTGKKQKVGKVPRESRNRQPINNTRQVRKSIGALKISRQKQ